MKNFRRSLRYLWPYRARLGVSAGCVVLIAILWGSGLGMILPALKVLISDEGLHGWAWDTMTEDRLNARVVSRMVPSGMQERHKLPALVVDVISMGAGGPAERAGVKPGDWIVAVDRRVLRADVLLRTLGCTDAAQRVRLRVFDQRAETGRAVEVELGELAFGSEMLGRVARAIPEPTTQMERFPILVWLLAIGLAMTLMRDLLRFIQEYLVQSTVFRATMDLRCENFGVALRLPMTFFAMRGTSDTMSRFIADTGELSRGQITLFGKTLVEPAKAIGSVAAAMVIDWKLTLLALVAGPPAVWLVSKFGKRMRKASRRALESRSEMLGVLEETLTGIRVVKAYTMEGSERKRFFGVNRRLLKQQRRMARIDSATAPSVEAIGVTGALFVAALAGYFVFSERMDPFYFMAWMGCLAAIFDPVRKLAKVATRFQRAEAAAERVFELQDRPQEVSLPGAPMLAAHCRSIELRNVSFRYPAAAADVLKNIDLCIEAGQTLAIVGPNGSGKTTLVSLIPRLVDPTAGTVLIDGQDISKVSLRSLRRQIGVVTQETILFHATIAQNIAYGLRRPKREAVLAAAKKAFVDEFARELPDGYETLVGEHGATLSGGQRQRIAVARAILRDPAILIFDEAMSQIDADSERRIHQAMAEFIRGRTTLLIAHRFATVLSAERIVVMDAGRIVDCGRHEELLDRCQLYRHLYQTQFVDSGG